MASAGGRMSPGNCAFASNCSDSVKAPFIRPHHIPADNKQDEGCTMRVEGEAGRAPFIDLGGTTRLDNKAAEKREEKIREERIEETVKVPITQGLGRIVDRTV